MDEIADTEMFRSAGIRPKPDTLGFRRGNDYDHLIAGWVAYWNDMQGDIVHEPLHPRYVKALIASESGFDPKADAPNRKRGVGRARGLVQLTDQTTRILRAQNGELKDDLVILTKEDLASPNRNIAASVRWLFRKYETAKARLKREPSWEEVLWEYKGITGQKGPESDKIRKQLRDYLERLK